MIDDAAGSHRSFFLCERWQLIFLVATITLTPLCQGQSTCAAVSCPQYSRCVEIGGTASCQCFLCKAVYSPVCGSDGNTYSNECQLKSTVCREKRSISVVKQGKCEVSLCDTVRCGYGSTCTVVDGSAKCECPTNCPAIFAPVCGNDGITYSSECHLSVQSCLQKKNIAVAHKGQCKPNKCATIRCGFYSTCQEVDGVAKCVCPTACITLYAPVCGSDGKTYSNDCLRMAASCKEQKSITVSRKGTCDAPPDKCATIRCGFYSNCQVVNGVAKCVCPTACPRIYAPVCGSDGKTYSNDCELRVVSCKEQKSITVSHKGTCDAPPDKCATIRCGFYSNCQVVNSVAKCVCPTACPRIYAPVCGSDGKTYTNDCELRVVSCKEQKLIRVYKKGKCDTSSCESVRCGYYSRCEVVKGSPKCVCPMVCADIYSPVCGTDGIVYSNECYLRMESCRQQKAIRMTHFEECEHSGGKTHEAVKPGYTTILPPPFNQRLNKQESGQKGVPCNGVLCIYGTCLPYDGSKSCLCSMCSAPSCPVLADDGKTYINVCSMEFASCSQNRSISVVSPCDRHGFGKAAQIATYTSLGAVFIISAIVVLLVVYFRIYRRRVKQNKVNGFVTFSSNEIPTKNPII